MNIEMTQTLSSEKIDSPSTFFYIALFPSLNIRCSWLFCVVLEWGPLHMPNQIAGFAYVCWDYGVLLFTLMSTYKSCFPCNLLLLYSPTTFMPLFSQIKLITLKFQMYLFIIILGFLFVLYV